MNTEKELFLAYLEQTLNAPLDQIAPLVYKKGDDDTLTEQLSESALEVLLQRDRDRVKGLQPPPVDTQKHFDNGYKKAELEISERKEKEWRKAFGVDAEGKLKGDALIAACKAAMVGDAQNLDKVKIHPEYLSLEQRAKEEREVLLADFEAKYSELKTTFEREKQWADMSGRLRSAFKGLNPVLPKDAAKAEREIDIFIEQNFREFDFMPTEDGRFLAMNGGQRVNNPHGHPMYMEDLVKQKASDLFDFDLQAPIGNAGNSNDGKPTVKFKFKDENDFLRQFAEAQESEKAAMGAAWNTQEGK